MILFLVCKWFINEWELSHPQQPSRRHCRKRENSLHNIRHGMVWEFNVSNGLQFVAITGHWVFPFYHFKRHREHISLLPGTSYNLCCSLASGTDDNGSKWSHFGGNLEELVCQDSIVCSSCWFGLHRLLHYWVTNSTLLCFVQNGGNDRKRKPVLYCCNSRRKRFRVFLFPDSRRHGNNSCRNMAAYESKISSYSASNRHSLYDVCNFANCVFFLPRVQLVWYKKFFSTFSAFFVFGTTLCFVITVFSYFKVYRIIRPHQSQIQTNQNAIDIDKYKKSVFNLQFCIFLHYFYWVTFPLCVAF